MPRYNHMLFGKYPIQVEYDLVESEHSKCCETTHVTIYGVYDEDNNPLEIVESQDIYSFLTGKIVEAVQSAE